MPKKTIERRLSELETKVAELTPPAKPDTSVSRVSGAHFVAIRCFSKR